MTNKIAATMNATARVAEHIAKMGYDVDCISFYICHECKITLHLDMSGHAAVALGTFESNEAAYEWLMNGGESSSTINACVDCFFNSDDSVFRTVEAIINCINESEIDLPEAIEQVITDYVGVREGIVYPPYTEEMEVEKATCKVLLQFYKESGLNVDDTYNGPIEQSIFHSDLINMSIDNVDK